MGVGDGGGCRGWRCWTLVVGKEYTYCYGVIITVPYYCAIYCVLCYIEMLTISEMTNCNTMNDRRTDTPEMHTEVDDSSWLNRYI